MSIPRDETQQMADDTARFYRKLGVKVVAVILVCSLLPLAATTAVSESTAETALESEAIGQQRAAVAGVADNVATRSEFYRKQVRIVKRHPAVEDLVEYRYGNETLSRRAANEPVGTAYPTLLGDHEAYAETQSFFAGVAEDDPGITMIRVFWKDGSVLTGYKRGAEDTEDYRGGKAWFDAVMDDSAVGDDEVHVSPINVARSTGTPTIRYAMPIQAGGERVGAVVIDYDAHQILEPVESVELGDDGYGMMIDPNYTNAEGNTLGPAYVAHGANSSLAFDESVAGNLSLDVARLAGESGTLDFERGGETWRAVYHRITLANGREYYAVTAVPEAQILAAARSLRETSLLIAAGAALVVLLAGAYFSRRITGPITRLARDADAVAAGDVSREIRTSDYSSELEVLTRSTRQMKANVVEALDNAEELTDHLEAKAADYEAVMTACGEGDLTARMDPESRSDAMTDIAVAFNDMARDWEAVMTDLTAFADDVADASAEVTASTDEVREASEEVSESVRQISAGSKRQSEGLDGVADEMNDLSATVEEIAAAAEEVARRSSETADVGRDGGEAAEDAIAEMRAVETRAAETAARMRALDDRMTRIGDVSQVITDIAEQTNLLALNANIEAAAADAGGEGFAVVAEEVKSLAEETGDSAAEIADVVDEVQAESAAAVAEVETTRERVERGVEVVAEAADALDSVAENVEETDVGVQEIHDATDTQAASTGEVVETVEDVAAISEESAAESENVATAAQQQTAALDEVARTAAALADGADDLAALAGRFDVEADGTGTAGTGLDDDAAGGESEDGAAAARGPTPMVTDGRGVQPGRADRSGDGGRTE